MVNTSDPDADSSPRLKTGDSSARLVDDTGHGPGDDAAGERARLVRLCGRLTGDLHTAEDLAQETLVVAWRHERELRDPLKRTQWLSGIARNVCLHWMRRRGVEQARLAYPWPDSALPGRDDEPADTFDLEIALERDELAHLLNRALALLPPDTRSALVERYIHESPYAEIATRLGVNEDTVAKRVERGKLTLRRVLTTDLATEAAAFGLTPPHSDTWQETRIWCPRCGRHKLLGRFDAGAPQGRFLLRCPTCDADPESLFSNTNLTVPPFAHLLGSVKGYKPALSRLMAWVDGYYRRGLVDMAVACVGCGCRVPLRTEPPEGIPGAGHRSLYVWCATCGAVCWEPLDGLILSSPEGRRFWQQQRRIRMLPEREIEANGQPALVTRFQSVSGAAHLDIVSARDTYAVLGAHGHVPRLAPPHRGNEV